MFHFFKLYFFGQILLKKTNYLWLLSIHWVYHSLLICL